MPIGRSSWAKRSTRCQRNRIEAGFRRGSSPPRLGTARVLGSRRPTHGPAARAARRGRGRGRSDRRARRPARARRDRRGRGVTGERALTPTRVRRSVDRNETSATCLAVDRARARRWRRRRAPARGHAAIHRRSRCPLHRPHCAHRPHRRRISTPPAPDTARQRPRPSIGHVTRRHVEPPSPRRTSRAWITFAEPRVSPPPGCRIRALRSCSPSRSTRRHAPNTNGVEEGKGYREALLSTRSSWRERGTANRPRASRPQRLGSRSCSTRESASVATSASRAQSSPSGSRRRG